MHNSVIMKGGLGWKSVENFDLKERNDKCGKSTLYHCGVNTDDSTCASDASNVIHWLRILKRQRYRK